MRRHPIIEAYEDEADPSVQDFWSGVEQDRANPYSRHPLIAKHGKDLSRESYQYTADRGDQNNLPPRLRQRAQSLMGLVQKISEKEMGYEEELQEAAKRIVSKIYGISEDKLYAELVEFGEIPNNIQERQYDVDPEDVELNSEINKRTTANLLTHGAAIHGMMSAHQMEQEALDQIDPELRTLYSQLAATAHQTYWAMNPQVMARMSQARAGESHLERDSNGKICVVARASTFPVLVQELIKGTMELLSLHGMKHLDKATHAKVTNVADDPDQNAWKEQIGPALWRKLIAILPRGQAIGELMAKLHGLSEGQLHRLLNTVIEDPEKAKRLIIAILQ